MKVILASDHAGLELRRDLAGALAELGVPAEDGGPTPPASVDSPDYAQKCLGQRTLGPGLSRAILQAFLATPFEGGRHQRRLDKIREAESQRGR